MSVQNAVFALFGKNALSNASLWSHMIAEHFKDNFTVETATASQAEPDCSGYTVELAGAVKFCDSKCVNYLEVQDEAKWGFNERGTAACYADLDFLPSQNTRGGGAICTNDANAAEALKSAVVDMTSGMTC